MKKLTLILLIMFVSFTLINESSAQKYYATTYKGGYLGVGAIIEYNAATGTVSNKVSFSDYGFNYAYCDLIFYNYKFYGTVGGGMSSTGCLYEYDPFTNVFTVKATFTSTTGTEPRGTMVIHNNKFYGMTYAGGANSAGTIYEYDPATNVLTKRYDFVAATGSNPQGGLSHYGGFLYGMTRNGGASNVGVIFQFNPTTFAYTKKYDFSFSGQGGGNPDGSLTLYNNKFYGMTANGGSGSGILFEYDPATSVFTKKITLNHTIGRRPYGNLTVADSKLYGMTSEADTANFNKGVIFEYNPATNVYTKKHEFNGNGANPEGSLLYDNNKFYGMTTYGGGPANSGTVFEYDHVTNVLTYKSNIDPNGKEPQGGFVRLPFYPELDMRGNGISILDGDVTPDINDHTDYGTTGINVGNIRRFTIKNSGDAPMVWPAFSLTGADASSFSIVNPPNYIGPGDTNHLYVRFNPTTAGVKNATININAGDPDETPFNFDIKGTATTVERGLTFDGNDAVNIPTNPNFNFSTGTVEFWVKPNYSTSSFRYLLVNSDNSFIRWALYMNADRQGVTFYNGTAAASWPFNFTQTVWYHLAFVQSGSSIKCYVNGIYAGVHSIGPSGITNKPLSIGNLMTSGFGLVGSMDDVRIWSSQRTQEQIQANMNSDIPQQAELLAYYRFDQGVENGNNAGLTTALDYSGNCYKGTLNNFALTGSVSNWTAGASINNNVIGFPASAVTGNSVAITDGSTTPSLLNNTDFGSTSNPGSISKYYSIQNTGTGNLNISNITISGPDASAFTATNYFSNTNLGAGQSMSFKVIFNGSSAGLKTATVNINTNNCDIPVYDFAVQANVLEADRGISFNGTDNYISRPYTPAYKFSSGTWEFWLKPSSTLPYDPVIIASRTGNTYCYQIALNGSRNSISFTSNGILQTWGYTFEQNQWYHVAIVTNGGTTEAFINGVSMGTKSAGPNTSNNTNFSIGRSGSTNPSFNNYFNGSLDEIRIWNVVRTPAQIQANMNADIPQQAGLVGYYRFDQGIANGNNAGITEALDFSGNCHSMSLNNFALTGTASNFTNGALVITNPINFPEMELRGNGIVITDGDTTTSIAKGNDFGTIVSGGNLSRTFKVHNTGSASLTVSSAFMSGPDASSFTMQSISSNTILPGDSATFDVTFSPLTPGTKKSVLTLVNTDCDEGSYELALLGNANPSFTAYNIKLIPEGFYKASEKLNMNDTVRAFLHNSSAPFNAIDSADAIIDSVTFTGVFVFNNAASGIYYIRLSHRNSLETWSKTGGETFIQGTTLNYDFTDNATKAFGNNMKSVDGSPVRFGIYGGDVNKSQTIDLNDIVSIFNSSSSFGTGYNLNDLTGDKIVNLNDLTIVYNNSALFVTVIKP